MWTVPTWPNENIPQKQKDNFIKDPSTCKFSTLPSLEKFDFCKRSRQLCKMKLFDEVLVGSRVLWVISQPSLVRVTQNMQIFNNERDNNIVLVLVQ